MKDGKKSVTQISVHGKPMTDKRDIAQHLHEHFQGIFYGETVAHVSAPSSEP